jgi:hypothetical protein
MLDFANLMDAITPYISTRKECHCSENKQNCKLFFVLPAIVNTIKERNKVKDGTKLWQYYKNQAGWLMCNTLDMGIKQDCYKILNSH